MTSGRAIGIVGSWWLTELLLLGLTAAYLALSLGRNPYPVWVNMLFHSAAGITVVIILIINLTAASIRIVIERFRSGPLTADHIRSLDAFIELPHRNAETIRKASKAFRIPAVENTALETGIVHVTGRWSFIPGAVFRTGLALTLIGLLVSAHTRRTSDIVLQEGGHAASSSGSLTLVSVKADLPTDHLQVGEDGTFRLEGVSAQLDVNGATAIITPGFPAWIRGTWYRIRHLGYSQEMTVFLHGKQHRITSDLDLLPPGRSSAVPLPGKASLSFSLDPDRTIEKGLLKGRQYNLAKPAYRIAFRGGRQQEDGTGASMRPGERELVGPATVSLGRQGLAVRIQGVSDPGLPLLYAGAILLLTGLCALVSRFFWYEREIALLAKDGVLLIGSRDEFFRKWGIQRFLTWSDNLRQ